MTIAIETPDSVQRKIDFLRDSFAQLVASFPTDDKLKDIARQFDTWHYNATNSILDKLFVSAISEEYDSWQRRYIEEYQRLTGNNPEIETTAPSPNVIKTDEKSTTWFVLSLMSGTILGLIAAMFIRRK